MAGGTLTLWIGLAGALALGCVADPVTRRDDDPLDAGIADAAVVAPALDADPVDAAPAPEAAPRTPECVLEADDPRNGETIHRCELFDRDRLSVCEQFAQCLCVANFEYEFADGDWLAADLHLCIYELLERRGEFTLADYCWGSHVVGDAAHDWGTRIDEAFAPLRPLGPACDTLVMTFERPLPWPMPEDDHCTLTVRDLATEDSRTCPISAASSDGTCEQIAYCLCASTLDDWPGLSNDYFYCLLVAFYGDLKLSDRCGSLGGRVADVSGSFVTPKSSEPDWRLDVTPSPGCADVPLDPRSGAAPR